MKCGSGLSGSGLSGSGLSGSSVVKSWRGDAMFHNGMTKKYVVYIDNEHLIRLVEECIPLWDSRDQQYKDTVVTQQLWNEVAAAMMDGWDSASPSSKRAFMNKIRTRWRSMKDRFNTDVRAEGQVRSGSAARRRRKYRYYRELAFLRPILASRVTWSSTLKPVPGAVLHRSTSDPSQPSDSQEASCRSATQTAGDQEAGPSDVPLSQVSVTGYAGTTRQRQRASDRPVMSEFMLLSEAFKGSLKALSVRIESCFSLMERGFNHMEHRFHSVDQHLDRLEADLNRPAHHFFSKIEQGMAEHLSPEQQLSVLQACNTAYLQAMQQNRYVQQSVVSFPTVPPLTRFTTPLPTSAAYHCTATCISSEAGHHYTTPSLSAAGHSSATTTMASAAPVWSTTTATVPPAWSQTTTEPAWATDTTSQHERSTASTPHQRSTASTPHQRSTASTPHQRSTASTPHQRSTTSTPHQRSTTTTPHLKSTATNSPPRSPPRTSAEIPDRQPPSRSTDTTTSLSTDPNLSPSRSTATATSSSTATTEQQRGDPHSLFYRETPQSTITKQSSNVRQSQGARWSGQDTPAAKKRKKKTLFVHPPSPPNVSEPASMSIPELPSPSTFVAPSPRTPSSTSSRSSSLHTPKVSQSSPKRHS
ncbi:uncharacterized protein [Dendrobates tinctorius]